MGKASTVYASARVRRMVRRPPGSTREARDIDYIGLRYSCNCVLRAPCSTYIRPTLCHTAVVLCGGGTTALAV